MIGGRRRCAFPHYRVWCARCGGRLLWIQNMLGRQR